MKKRNVITSIKNPIQIQGLNILIPKSVNNATIRRARALGKKELELKRKIMQAKNSANSKIAIWERQIANLIKDRTFEVKGYGSKQSKLILTSKDGKKLTIYHVRGRTKKELVTDLGEFSKCINYISIKMGL
ncbi:MAG: hypothetical protein PHY04_03980 [Candidatus ainarchaeum sp.]|nr:hypothetical protein [Candidatus ainarchaeum sp.]MDD3086067.1 hypothetical protein [Candidatus ainarchaeum sp.]MDD4128867.1 hypothetical protein [Candidatus ainarchaeum sp.]